VRDYLDHLVAGNYAASTKRLYASAPKGFLKYLHQRELTPGLELQILFDFAANQLPRVGQRLPQFPRDEIGAIIRYAEDLGDELSGDENQRLIDLRDRAFILTLADTGLRVQEACSLRRAQLEWHEGRALVAGKGDKQAVVRFSKRALQALFRHQRGHGNRQPEAGPAAGPPPRHHQHPALRPPLRCGAGSGLRGAVQCLAGTAGRHAFPSSGHPETKSRSLLIIHNKCII
jgi:site-specific recombinase XerD